MSQVPSQRSTDSLETPTQTESNTNTEATQESGASQGTTHDSQLIKEPSPIATRQPEPTPKSTVAPTLVESEAKLMQETSHDRLLPATSPREHDNPAIKRSSGDNDGKHDNGDKHNRELIKNDKKRVKLGNTAENKLIAPAPEAATTPILHGTEEWWLAGLKHAPGLLSLIISENKAPLSEVQQQLLSTEHKQLYNASPHVGKAVRSMNKWCLAVLHRHRGQEITTTEKLNLQGWKRHPTTADGNCGYDSVLRGLVGTELGKTIQNYGKVGEPAFDVRHGMRMLAAYKSIEWESETRAASGITPELKEAASRHARNGIWMESNMLQGLQALVTKLGYKILVHTDNNQLHGQPKPSLEVGNGSQAIIIINAGRRNEAGIWRPKHWEYMVQESHEFISLQRLAVEVVAEYEQLQAEFKEKYQWEIPNLSVSLRQYASKTCSLSPLTAETSPSMMKQLESTLVAHVMSRYQRDTTEADETKWEQRLAVVEKAVLEQMGMKPSASINWREKLTHALHGYKQTTSGIKWGLTEAMCKQAGAVYNEVGALMIPVESNPQEFLKLMDRYGLLMAAMKLQTEQVSMTRYERALSEYIDKLEVQLQARQTDMQLLNDEDELSAWETMAKRESPTSTTNAEFHIADALEKWVKKEDIHISTVRWRHHPIKGLQWSFHYRKKLTPEEQENKWQPVTAIPTLIPKKVMQANPVEQTPAAPTENKVNDTAIQSDDPHAIHQKHAPTSMQKAKQRVQSVVSTSTNDRTTSTETATKMRTTHSQKQDQYSPSRCFYFDLARCRFGTNCAHAHIEDNLPTKDKLLLHKWRPSCRGGPNCRFQHTGCPFQHEQPPQPDHSRRSGTSRRAYLQRMVHRTCWEYQRTGSCQWEQTYGACRFMHPPPARRWQPQATPRWQPIGQTVHNGCRHENRARLDTRSSYQDQSAETATQARPDSSRQTADTNITSQGTADRLESKLSKLLAMLLPQLVQAIQDNEPKSGEANRGQQQEPMSYTQVVTKNGWKKVFPRAPRDASAQRQ